MCMKMPEAILLLHYWISLDVTPNHASNWASNGKLLYYHRLGLRTLGPYPQGRRDGLAVWI